MKNVLEKISKVRQEVSALKNKREGLEQKLLGFRQKMARGTLIKMFTSCKTKNCKCQKGERHGPFLYVNAVVKGKSIHKYVGKQTDQKLVNSIKKYKEFKSSITALNKVNKEMSALWQTYRNLLTKELV